MTSNGEPFHFLPIAPDVLFCKGSPSMKKVIMTIQPDLLQSASKRRQASAIVAPRVLTKKRKMITRRVIKISAPASPSPSEANTNQVTHLSKTSPLLRTYVLWLTVILFSGCSWRNPQCRKPGSTWDGCNSSNKLIQSMFLTSTLALIGRLLPNRPTLLLQNR